MSQTDTCGAFDHLEPSIRHLATADDAERLRAIESDAWLPYPPGEAVVDRLLELVRMPKRVRMPSLLVYAPPNSGKTRIIRRFLDLYLEEEARQEIEPGSVVAIQAPPTVDEKRLYLEILRGMQAPMPDVTVPRLRAMVVRHMEARTVRLLIIDEMQHILDQRASAQQIVLNTLKYLSNELSIAVAGFGSGEARALIKADEHLAQRFEIVGLPRWAKKERWVVELVRARVAHLPLRKPTKVDKALMNTLHVLAGNMGAMFALLEKAAKEAIRTGTECITVGLLEQIVAQREQVEHGL